MAFCVTMNHKGMGVLWLLNPRSRIICPRGTNSPDHTTATHLADKWWILVYAIMTISLESNYTMWLSLARWAFRSYKFMEGTDKLISVAIRLHFGECCSRCCPQRRFSCLVAFVMRPPALQSSPSDRVVWWRERGRFQHHGECSSEGSESRQLGVTATLERSLQLTLRSPYHTKGHTEGKGSELLQIIKHDSRQGLKTVREAAPKKTLILSGPCRFTHIASYSTYRGQPI